MTDGCRNNRKRLPIDRGWGWVIVIACFGHVMLAVMTLRATSILFVRFMDKYNATVGTISFLPGLICFGELVSCFFSAALSEKVGVRPVVFVGTLLWATGLISSGFVDDTTALSFTYGLLVGIGMGFVYFPSFTLLGKYFDERRTLAFAIAGTGSGCGSVIGPILSETLASSYGLSGCLLLLGGLQLHNFIFASLLRPLEFFKKKSSVRISPKTVEKPVDARLLLVRKMISAEQKALSASTQNISSPKPSENETDDFFNCPPRPRAYTFQNGASADAEQLRLMFLEWRQRHRNVNIQEYLKQKSNPSRRSSFSSQDSNIHRLQTHSAILPNKNSNSNRALNKTMSHSITIAVPANANSDECDNLEENRPCFGKDGLVQCSLFTNPVFMLHAFHSILAVMAVPMPHFFIGAYCTDIGISLESAAMLFSISGVAELLVHPLIGWLSKLNIVRKLHLKVASLVVIIALTFSWTFVTTFAGILVLETLASVAAAVFFLLEAAVLLEVLDSDNMSSALGMNLTLQSVGYLCGPIISGYIRDRTGSWDWCYSLTGLIGIASIITLLTVPFYKKCTSNTEGTR